jgi:DNA-binding CsgD family transcriptional regulator
LAIDVEQLRLENLSLRLGVEPDRAAVFLLTAKANVLTANAVARARLREGGVFVGLDQTLGFADQKDQGRFETAMKLDGTRPRDMWLPSETFSVRLILVPPDLKEHFPPKAGASAHTLMVLSRNVGASGVQGVLRDAFGLTASEADLAVLVTESRTLNEIAASRGTSIHTVRNQIKSALAKTGCRRQVELVALVERLRR